MLVPINLTGNSYKLKAKTLSNQATRNLHPVKINDDPNMKDAYVLESFVGQVLFGTQSDSILSRGITDYGDSAIIRVCGQKLYTVDTSGNHTFIGSINGTGRIVFTKLVDKLIIISGGYVYQYDGTTLIQITDSNLEQPASATTLNNQVIYQGYGARFCTSNVGDATTINGLNYATAESNPDNLVRVYAFEEQVYLFGKKTIERWWNTGTGHPPFDRVQGGIIIKGLLSRDSVSDNGDNIFFLGDDSKVYTLKGGALNAISTQSLAQEFYSYGDISDAVGWCATLRGDQYYFLKFPTQNKFWVYKDGLGWFEWSSGIEGAGNIATGYVFAFNHHYVEANDGNIYQLDFDTYTENGNPIIKLRDSSPIHGGLLGADGKRVTMNRLQLIMETGVGTPSGQTFDPEVVLQFSDDGGKTFGTERRGKIGKLGINHWRVEWHCLGSFFSRIIRIKMSDSVFLSIHRCNADIEVGI